MAAQPSRHTGHTAKGKFRNSLLSQDVATARSKAAPALNIAHQLVPPCECPPVSLFQATIKTTFAKGIILESDNEHKYSSEAFLWHVQTRRTPSIATMVAS